MHNQYTTVEDLLTDESFMAWHLQADIKAMELWNTWINEHEQHGRLAEEAIRLLALIKIEEKEKSASDTNEAVDRLLNTLKDEKPFPKF
jgi:hypothetical protein